MSYGSYYGGDYYRNPTPYTSSDIGEPVPGWGVNLRVAGPARVGVGALNMKLLPRVALVSPTAKMQEAAAAEPQTVEEGGTPGSSGDGMPTYVWVMAGVFILGGAYAAAKNYKVI